MSKRTIAGVNAGSMADIAFLLLIFFMMTASMEKDKGLARLLPAKNIDKPIVDIKQKNLFEVRINKSDELFVEKELMGLHELRQAAIDFIDNGGAIKENKNFCNYCEGKRDIASSDNPLKAVVSVTSDRLASYKTYIAVQNELVSAYNFLRNRASQRRYGWKFTEIKKKLSEGSLENEELYKEKIKEIQNLYPLHLVEAELID